MDARRLMSVSVSLVVDCSRTAKYTLRQRLSTNVRPMPVNGLIVGWRSVQTIWGDKQCVRHLIYAETEATTDAHTSLAHHASVFIVICR